MRGKDGRLDFNKKDKNIWKKHMEKIMHEENHRDHMKETNL